MSFLTGQDLEKQMIFLFSHLELIPDYFTFQKVKDEAYNAGQIVLKEVAKEIGLVPLLWGLNRCKLPNRAASGATLLGWGYKVTEFLISPIALEKKNVDSLARLGGLANLIVNLYDHVLDNNLIGDNPISEEYLQRLAIVNVEQSSVNEYSPYSIEGMLTGLISLYMNWIRQRTYYSERVLVSNLIMTTIIDMYRAGINASPNQNGTKASLSKTSIIKKDSYPFILMGLPAWLVSKDLDMEQFIWHYDWMFRVGAFYGQLDDAIDLKEDRERGFSNLFLDDQVSDRDSSDWNLEISKRITRYGKKIIIDWENYTERSKVEKAKIRDIFTSSIVTWFGSSHAYPVIMEEKKKK